MQALSYLCGQPTDCVYDQFIWNRADETKAGFIISVRLNSIHLKDLSSFTWDIYTQILAEFEDMESGYFEENEEEPFPAEETTIQHNPLLIDAYLKQSTLWRDYILGEWLFTSSGDTVPSRYIIGYKGATMEGDELVLTFYAG